MRDILDDVMTGAAEAVIERHGKPTAVIVNYAQWKAWRRQRQERIAQARKEMDAGEFITEEEMVSNLRNRAMMINTRPPLSYE